MSGRSLVVMALGVGGCVPFGSSADVDVVVDLNEIDADCTPEAFDVGDETSAQRAIGDVTPFEAGGSLPARCSTAAVVLSEAIDWQAIRDELPGAADLQWRAISPRLDRFTVDVVAADAEPQDAFIPGTRLTVFQALVRTADAERFHANVDDHALTYSTTFAYASRFQSMGEEAHVLFYAEHVFDGTEPTDLATMAPEDWDQLLFSGPGLVDTLDASFTEDDVLHALTYADVQVPLDALEPFDGTPLRIEAKIEAAIDYEGRLSVSL